MFSFVFVLFGRSPFLVHPARPHRVHLAGGGRGRHVCRHSRSGRRSLSNCHGSRRTTGRVGPLVMRRCRSDFRGHRGWRHGGCPVRGLIVVDMRIRVQLCGLDLASLLGAVGVMRLQVDALEIVLGKLED